MAVAYDLVLEDRILSREAVRRRARPFAQEIAEMVRHAVGYHSRAFVTFGQPIALATFDPESRRDLVTLAHRVQDAIGLAYKVLPTALVASAMRAQITRRELGDRLDELVATLGGDGANLSVRTRPGSARRRRWRCWPNAAFSSMARRARSGCAIASRCATTPARYSTSCNGRPEPRIEVNQAVRGTLYAVCAVPRPASARPGKVRHRRR